MALSPIEHIESIVNHLNMVRTNCLSLGKKLVAQGRSEFGRDLIARGFKHDLSKFTDPEEWSYLHCGKDVERDKLKTAIEIHRKNNDHHVEHWGDISRMPEISIAEMTCDIMARCQELGECFREWIDENIIGKHKPDPNGDQYKWINQFVGMLLENEFVK